MTDQVVVRNNNSSYVLHDSIYRKSFNSDAGLGRAEKEIDGKSADVSFFRYLDDIDKFLSQCDGDACRDFLICGGCCDQLSRMMERVYKFSQEESRSYAVIIHSFQTKAIHVRGHVESDIPILAASAVSHQQSEDCEHDLLWHIESIATQRREIREKMEAELLLISSMDSDLILLNADINKAVIHSDKVGHEINLLSIERSSLSVMFDLMLSSRSMSPSTASVAAVESGIGQHRRAERIGAVVNGMRLTCLPSAADNLNWAEINRAWSCLSLLVCCIRNEGGLGEKTCILIERYKEKDRNHSEVEILDADTTKTCMILRLRPLRRRTLILLSFDRFNSRHIHDADIMEEALCLCGEGSSEIGIFVGNFATSRTKNKDENAESGGLGNLSEARLCSFSTPDTFEQLRRNQYYRAVVAMAAIICATARDLNRVDCLTESLVCLDLSPLMQPSPCDSRSYECVADLVGEMCRSVRNMM
jgi:hypothetical protein